jgi:CHAT domain/SIR2-like domain
MYSDYIDCEYQLLGKTQANFAFHGAVFPGQPKFDDNTINALRKSSGDQKAYGTLLFQASFPLGSDLLTGFRSALALCRFQNKGSRFRMRIDTNAPSDLHNLEWELIYDPKERVFLAQTPETLFSRRLDIPLQPINLGDLKKLRMLVVIACPSDAAEFGLAVLNREDVSTSVRDAVSPLNSVIDVEFLPAPCTPLALRQNLVQRPCQLLHIQAHGLLRAGQSISKLVLETDQGAANFVDENELTEIVRGEQLRLITLIACDSARRSHKSEPFSGLAGALIRLGIPSVVAMQKTIGVEQARRFTEYFYRSLGSSGEVDKAANEARNQMYLVSSQDTDWAVPVLSMRLSDGKVAKRWEVHSPQVLGTDGFWDGLLQALKNASLIPILGPEVNRGLLLGARDIAKLWAEKYDYHKLNYPYIDRNDLPNIAQFVETKNSLNFPHSALLDLFKDDLLEREKISDRKSFGSLSLEDVISRVALKYFGNDNGAPHTLLSELPIHTYVSTNFDSFLVEALRLQGRKPNVQICRWRADAVNDSQYQSAVGSEQEPLIFKAFGYESDSTSMVLVEDDYIDFIRLISKDEWRLPRELRTSLTKSMLLFLGYDIRDWEFRVLFKGLVSQLREMRKDRIAIIQLDPDQHYEQKQEVLDQLREIIQKDCTRLKLIVRWQSLRDFVVELSNKWTGLKNG